MSELNKAEQSHLTSLLINYMSEHVNFSCNDEMETACLIFLAASAFKMAIIASRKEVIGNGRVRG